ncbi:MAG: M1 family metallopeptidase [Bacteroidota bacterium]
MTLKKHILLILILISSVHAYSQQYNFTRQDTLRGSITAERAWWDLIYYHLDIAVDPDKKSISGSNEVVYKVVSQGQTLQIDLQNPLKITKIIQNKEELKWRSEGNAHFIELTEKQKPGSTSSLTVFYEGIPRAARRAPWDGGISWKSDANGNPFVASSCQGLGASVWWPCKDHMYDEPDSMMISVEVPENLMNVSNGRLVKTKRNKRKKTKTYHWYIDNPIANYVVNINIGDYVQFGEKYAGEKGSLDVDYFVLRDNLEKAKVHFKEVPKMLKAFEHWFGPYPFYEDGYKLVEAPYLGMEHQSSVTYGNKYQNGYLGRDLSATGWGLKFDFIIIHESGHEWFANNITYADIADMWVHESFTNYSESLFTEYYFGKDAGQEYVRGTRLNIRNDIPIIGQYDVNKRGSGDMYYKGGNMLNMIRQILNDDDKWREILRGLNETFYHQVVTTEQIENYMIEQSGIDLSGIFDQYLRDTRIPVLDHYYDGNTLKYRWSNCVEGFNMPIDIQIGTDQKRIKATDQWREIRVSEVAPVTIEPNYYVGSMKIR